MDGREAHERQAPLEVRLEKRLDEMGGRIKSTIESLRKRGCGERELVAVVSMIDYVLHIAKDSYITPDMDQNMSEAYFAQIQEAIGAMEHGLVMGRSDERYAQQMEIAQNPGKLAKEVREALKRASPNSKIGSNEGRRYSETNL